MDSVRWENDQVFRAPAFDVLRLTIRACGKHDLVGSGVKSGEQFFDQPSFDATSFAWWNEVPDDRFEPGIFVYPKDHARVLANLQFIDRRPGEQVTKRLHARYHFLAQLFFGNFLHRA